MKNPFTYSNIVTGPYFCNRKKEQEDLLEFIRSSQNVLLYSHRRTGKSSLIKQLFLNIKQQAPEIGTLYIDLYGTTSEKEFMSRIFQQLNVLETNTDKLINLLKSSIDKFSFQIGIDPNTNSPTITPTFNSADENLVLKNLMELLEKFSAKRKIVIALDEFQEVAKYTDADSFEKRLRSYVQHHSNICYIFSGSQQHLLTVMFHSQGRAFYQQAASYPLKQIETKHYIPWMKQLFDEGNLSIEKANLIKIVDQFKNHPMYIQLFCFFLWRELQHTPWKEEMINGIERSMIDQKHLEYQTLWDNLSINQKKTLKLILINDGQNLFAAQTLITVSIKTASVVTRCLKTLLEKEVLVKNGRYIIQDLLFKKWLILNT
ncbi:MAG: ATP-binding protein [Proteobacteria bacterium]|nr:ATP-binding protein [Pseudomonadota bacterium]MBU1388679.1 ATP-binding protein [Pseudomonadota bacterium]MBU1541889.1 ATP-binding protein [Pseudomonadota bacterium]MBU2481592.1 ATP-binding protein [Pseudomonadota bacterium]